MRKVNNIIWVITLLIFVAVGNTYAQDTGALTDEIQKEKANLDQEKEKMKEKGKGEMKQERKRLQEKKKEMKGAMKKEKEGMKKGMGKGKGEGKGKATSFADLQQDEMKLLEEKLKKAKTEKEKNEIMKMIEAKKKGAKGDASTGTVKGEPKSDDNSATSATGRDDNDYDEEEGKGDVLKGKERGIAKANNAKAMVEKKEKDLDDKQELVRKGRERIAAAKDRLAVAIAEGKLSEDEISQKQAVIDRAEAGIDKLEASITSGKEVYAKKKATLSDMYKDDN